jgi:hypothetical protein
MAEARSGESGERHGCDQCWPPAADAAWDARTALKQVEHLVDDSHFGVSILVCLACRQQFVSVFLEEVDWVDGDDPQYWTMVPATEADVADLVRQRNELSEATFRSFAPTRQCLQRDCPKGTPCRAYWRTGIPV